MINIINKILYDICITQIFVNKTEFIYDTWNLISEGKKLITAKRSLSAIASTKKEPVTNNYYWGLDLSGTLAGAGGVGGLLQVILLPIHN